jgi:hypothetical protein
LTDIFAHPDSSSYKDHTLQLGTGPTKKKKKEC